MTESNRCLERSVSLPVWRSRTLDLGEVGFAQAKLRKHFPTGVSQRVETCGVKEATEVSESIPDSGTFHTREAERFILFFPWFFKESSSSCLLFDFPNAHKGWEVETQSTSLSG